MNAPPRWPASILAAGFSSAPSSRFPISAVKTAIIAACGGTIVSLSRLSRERFRELAELLIHHRPESVTDVNLQAGEDPIAIREIAIPLIQALRRETSLGISVCLGTLNKNLYEELRAAGASIYILKFETGSESLYSALEAPGEIFTERIEHIHALAADDWKVSSGFICGLPGEGDAELLRNFEMAGDLPLAGCSVSPFIPGDETPLAHDKAADINLTLNCMPSRPCGSCVQNW